MRNIVYLRRDAIAESVKERVAKAATEAIAGAPDMLDAAMPELPDATSGAIPSTTGLLSDMKKLMMALAAAYDCRYGRPNHRR